MPTDTLVAPISGSQNIAGVQTPQGFASAQMMVSFNGQNIDNRNHFPVAATQRSTVAGFSAVGASILDIFFNQTPHVGAGITFNQAAGSINILSGTTANAEFLAVSQETFKGPLRLRFSNVISQRIANQNFAILLADLVGEGLAYNIINATTVDVTLTAHGYTSQNIGQFHLLGGITGAAGVPGRYAIAAIQDVDTIRFTVAGWPANGSGTLKLFGRSYVRNLFNGTTVTNVAFDAQRNGWAAGDTVATINTTASPGVILANEITGRDVWLSDALRATSTAPDFTTRASRYENIPEIGTDYRVFLWVFNGSTAPASTTTWTIGHIAVEEFPNQSFYMQGIRSQGTANPLAVKFSAAQSVNATPVTSTVRLGFVVSHGIWWDDSSTVLAANATFTGSSRDLLVTATATAFANAATFAEEFRISAESDQSGTLWMDVSRDNAAWRRIKSVATTAVAGGGHYAEIIHSPSWRYSRVGFTNGAVAQTRFTIGSIAMGA
jgi:hypothetical protein